MDKPAPLPPSTRPRFSATFDQASISEIQRAAATGIYDIRGGGAPSAACRISTTYYSSGASMSRYPLEGYRERCDTNVTLGARFAKKPIELKTPVTIAGMSFGALSGAAKEALGRGATLAGTSTTTGDGGMTEEERGHSRTLVYQYLPSRYGMNPVDLRRADAIEIVVGQGAKPGGGGHAARAEDHRAGGGDAEPAAGDRSTLRLPPPGLDGAPMTSKSRSRRSGRSPAGRSRSMSRSARAAPITTWRWP